MMVDGREHEPKFTFGYKGVTAVGEVPYRLLLKYKDTLLRQGFGVTEKKFDRKTVKLLLIDCMRESEYIDFEEIPNTHDTKGTE